MNKPEDTTSDQERKPWPVSVTHHVKDSELVPYENPKGLFDEVLARTIESLFELGAPLETLSLHIYRHPTHPCWVFRGRGLPNRPPEDNES